MKIEKNFAALILAGGQGKRMKSEKPKILHDLCGLPMLSYAIRAARACRPKSIFCVIPSNSTEIKTLVTAENAVPVVQKNPLGTADAVLAAKQVLASFKGYLLIINGDVPLLSGELLRSFVSDTIKSGTKCALCSMKIQDGASYGRIIRDLDGHLVKIVEAVDASPEELQVSEVNAGVYCVDKEWLYSTLKEVSHSNNQHEFYLTDIVHVAVKQGFKVNAYLADNADEFLGINTRVELDHMAKKLRLKINTNHQLSGVGIVDAANTYIEPDVQIGKDTQILPFSFIMGRTRIGKNCRIENGVVIKNATIGDGATIRAYSVIDDSKISAKAIIGPFARLRPGADIGEEARVGNFVEVKKSKLGRGVKANHLTYLGDTLVGSGTNIGCGTITCNYDGKNKYRTTIGQNVFVGSDTQFIAPVKIGKNATIGAGSTVAKDVPQGALALSRPPLLIKRGWKRRGKK